jgi:hypothetical protein
MNPSERIAQLIAGLADWRGKPLASIRKIILEADREIIEEWKWMGSPVWSHDGIIAVGNAHKDKDKVKGASSVGTVFKLDTTGKETVLYSFTGAADGKVPAARLVLDGAGFERKQ